MGKRKATADNTSTNDAAVYLLRRGLMGYSDIAKRSGLSRQAIRQYALYHGLNPEAHEAHLDKLWQRALRHAER